MPPVETEYYDLLGVNTDVDDTELKKAYRRQAMKVRDGSNRLKKGDKNQAPGAEEKFKEISKAYHVLSDANMRAVYDKNGKSMVDKQGEHGIDDAAAFFANVFGGERFFDYIGEISLIKEMAKVATTVVPEEVMQDEVMQEANTHPHPASGPHEQRSQSPLQSGIVASSSFGFQVKLDASKSNSRSSSPINGGSDTASKSERVSSSVSPDPQAAKKRANKLTLDQKAKLKEIESDRRRELKERVDLLTTKLIELLRPFVESERAGADGEAGTLAFEAKIRREAEDLKLESFGVELLHTIGGVYFMKATSFMKSKKFLGIPGFFSRLKEKGIIAKDVWGLLDSAFSVRSLLEEIEKLQAKGETAEAELKALEIDVTGKVLLTSWRGTRLEVIGVLREVVDKILSDKAVSETVLLNRAKGLLIIGAIFKATEPDESDEERRELERMVAEAATGKSKHQQMQAQAKAAAAKVKKPIGKHASPVSS